MSTPPSGDSSGSGSFSRRMSRASSVIIVTSVMFTFISYWRTAAVVLCDLASTAYYIGAIVEQSIGPAAPWFILAVMCFSYAVRWVYIESCTMFVRGGVYRVVREALGKFMAKLAVSALMFDYILTGPISSVTAGQYIIGLFLDLLTEYGGVTVRPEAATLWKNWGSVVLACLVTLYFFYLNLRGIHESSDKALKIMRITTVMAVIMILWCLLTLAVKGMPQGNHFPSPEPRLTPRINYSMPENKRELEDPLGFLKHTGLAERLRGEPVIDPVTGEPVKGPDGN